MATKSKETNTMATKESITTVEIDALTGLQTVRELNADELAQRTKDAAEAKARQAEIDARVAARESALAKLAALGLSAEEIAAL